MHTVRVSTVSVSKATAALMGYGTGATCMLETLTVAQLGLVQCMMTAGGMTVPVKKIKSGYCF